MQWCHVVHGTSRPENGRRDELDHIPILHVVCRQFRLILYLNIAKLGTRIFAFTYYAFWECCMQLSGFRHDNSD